MDIRVRIAYQRSVNFSSYHCSYYSYDKETVVKHEVFEGRLNAWVPILIATSRLCGCGHTACWGGCTL